MQTTGLGRRYGDEAFTSKYKYALRRLTELPSIKLIEAAHTFLQDDDNFALSELLTKIDERRDAPITTLTRRRLIALFDSRPLSTQVDEVDLIRSVWPIAKMPSMYGGNSMTLEDNIMQHYVRNNDLTQRELLEALGLLSCSRKLLFNFLSAVTAPESLSSEQQTSFASEIDSLLRKDSYTLSVAGKISGSPYYRVKAIPLGSPADESISATLAAFDSSQVHARWVTALDRRTSEPEGAITLARTLLEDVCKWILHQANISFRDTDDLPVLYRKLAKVLKLAPDDHTEQVFKQILGSCQSVVESLGALRNKLGDAHSSGPKRSRPQSRHAELAVNLAGAMATFLISTWEARQR